MCGIAGAYWTGERPRDADAIVAAMTRAIAHRGPDSTGRSSARFGDVGFQRLAIIDLAGGDQPLRNEAGDVECFLNGEIYNYVELREWLKARGHVFRTASDTEVLPHLYEELGEEMFARLNGMFAVVVVDHRRQELLLARDHLGVKQMYYAVTPGAVLFASEVKAVLASGRLAPEVDRAGVLGYLTLFYCPEPFTLLRGLRKLPAGSQLRLAGGRAGEPRRFWQPSAEPKPISAADAARRTLEHLESAMRLQLRADVPVGLSLSGGVDSSALALAAARLGTTDVSAFTVTFEGTPEAEVRCARAVAEALGIRHRVLEPASDDVAGELPLLAWISDEPIADPATYSQFCIARAAREFVTVLLSGAGGDELFAGYSSYFRSPRQAGYAALPAALQSALGPWLARDAASRELLDALRALRASPLRMHARAMASLDAGERAELGARIPGSRDPFANFEALFRRHAGVDAVAQQSAVDLATYLPEQVLPMLDRATMAASVEGRVPFLDVDLVEFAMSVPGRLKVGWPPRPKRLLKRAIASGLPREVIERRKVGMPSPALQLLAHRGGRVFRGVLLAPDAFVRSLVPDGWLETRLRDAGTARRHYRVLYSLLVLEVWHRLFVRARSYERPTVSVYELCGFDPGADA